MTSESVRSICPYCGVGCGVVLETESGKLIGLKPDAEHPVSKGTLCPKGATAHEFVYHEDRLTEPMIRKNGSLVPVSWQEAYKFMASNFRRVIEQHGPESVGLISSSRATVEENYLAQKFARAVLQTNHIDNCFRICHSATAVGLKEVLGSGAMTNSISEFLDPAPKVLLVVGSNTPHAHPIIWNVWIKKALRNGMKLIVIDPRTTEIAEWADLHLKSRPGCEVALFNAMANHIISNNFHDPEFIAGRCENFDAMRELVSGYTPESVAEKCGLEASDIAAAAELYASAKPASIVYGLGVTEHRTGVDGVQTLANLCLITGNIGAEASGINALRGQNNVQGATDMCAPEWLPGYQSWTDEAVVSKFEEVNGAPLPKPKGDFIFCSRMWEEALAGQMKALYAIGTDPALTEGNLEKVEKALEIMDFVVVQEVFPNRTMPFADVVLPSCSFVEKDGTYINTERRVQRIHKAIEPLGESKPDWQILCELAQHMGYSGMNFENPEAVFEEMRKVVPLYAGISYQRIDEEDGVQWPCPDESHPGTKFLHEGSFARGKALLKAIHHFEAQEEPDDEFPMLLTTGRSFMQYNAGTMTKRTRAGLAEPENYVQVNANDAARLGINSGDAVEVSTRRGALNVPARISEIREGVIWMPFHYDENPTNMITNDAVDPICGITELKICAAKLTRA